MKNATLLFRSLAIIVCIAGMAHLASYASAKDGLNDKGEGSTKAYQEQDLPTEAKSTEENTKSNPDSDFILGHWKVNYQSEDFKGAVIFDIKKEAGVFHAYTYQYVDEKGYTAPAEGAKTLTLEDFDGYKGKGVYTVEYEQQQYQVDCQIDRVDENTFKLSYAYHGYSDVETWKRHGS